MPNSKSAQVLSLKNGYLLPKYHKISSAGFPHKNLFLALFFFVATLL